MRVDGSISTSQQPEVISHYKAKSRGRVPGPASGNGESVSTGDTKRVNPAPLDSTPKAPGVIRNLEAGHYRGVADVRLRINFAEELQGIQTAGVQALLGEGLPALQENFNAAIDGFVESGNLTDEEVAVLRSAQDEFNAQVRALLEGDGGEADAPTEVFAELRTAFQDFLNALIPPGEEEVPVTPLDPPEVRDDRATTETEVNAYFARLESGTTTIELDDSAIEGVALSVVAPAAPAPGTTTTTTATTAAADVFAGLRDTLSGIVEDAIAGLQESLNALALPPISEPSGQGRAFEKFLAIYNERYGIGDDSASNAPDVGIDTVT